MTGARKTNLWQEQVEGKRGKPKFRSENNKRARAPRARVHRGTSNSISTNVLLHILFIQSGGRLHVHRLRLRMLVINAFCYPLHLL